MEDNLLFKTLLKAFNSIEEGIIVTDSEGKITYYNNILAKLEDLSPENVVGKHLFEVYTVVPVENSEHLSVIQTGTPILEKPRTYFTNKGKEVTIVASTFPVFEDGRVVAAYSVCKDITKLKELLIKNRQLHEQIGLEAQEQHLNNGTRYTFNSFIFVSSTIKALLNSAKKAAETDGAVLVFGETGTGKELLVQAIHNHSARKNEPFVAINCAAIPETLLESTLFGTAKGAFTGAVEAKGLFEQAANGTLFLDELNSMSINLQAKLLRVLQEKTIRRVGRTTEIPVFCRVISSTNGDPWESIDNGTMRKDLFYRLAALSLYIPPLRERSEDIEALINYFLKKYQRIYGSGSIRLSPELRYYFLKYPWPGNVRELEHILESATNMLDGETIITIDHLPYYLKSKLLGQENPVSGIDTKGSGTLGYVLRDAEREAINEALKRHQGNITKAADSLGIARQNLQYRMRKLGIENA